MFCFIYRWPKKRMSNHEYSITSIQKKREEESMSGKVSGSQVPNSPGGEKQGWPVKVFRAGEGGIGFLRVFRDVCREEKTVRRAEG